MPNYRVHLSMDMGGYTVTHTYIETRETREELDMSLEWMREAYAERGKDYVYKVLAIQDKGEWHNL